MVQQDSWHSLPVEEALTKLDSSEDGLTETDVAERLAKYGANELGEEEKTRKLTLFLNQIKNPLIGVLIAAALISLLVAHYIDALVIAVVIIINAIIGFFQEYKAETALQALKTMAGPETKVLRKSASRSENVEVKVKAKELVPGDIILLEAGVKVPADARIFQAFNLEIDESMLTGESEAVRKKVEVLSVELQVADRTNMAFSGTIVVQGRGKALVVATGTKTEIGKIAELIKGTERVETPIQKQTKDLSKKLGLFALLASSLVLVIAVLRGFDFFETFLFALATAVSAIPEGLPAVLTVTLAVGVNRMAKRNALIRKLQAVDTLGSATVICTDKTGTLTTNQMTVRKIFADNKLISLSGEGFNPEGTFEFENQPVDVAQNKSLRRLLQIAALCNDAKLIRKEQDGKVHWEIIGDPTEGALVVAASKAGLTKEALEGSSPRVDEIPFDSKERYMVTFHRETDSTLRVFVKGAPEVILSLCTRVLENDIAKDLTQNRKQELLNVSTQMASQALRVLAIAYQTINIDETEETKLEIKQKRGNLVFVGLTGMIDPPRSEAKSAVVLCKRAGIRVVMATGDHKLTAEAIAKELGITGSSGAVTGGELDAMSDQQLDAVISQTAVFARVSPTHKFRIVESLRRKGHVVAMTGDGVNDAPALKAADIGIAMGITGTDVTKETADMVLTDDNFASIVNAIKEGRVIFENIRKVVKYLISTNTGEIMTILCALIFLPTAPLIFTAVQILWVNLVTDGLLVIPLALEPQEENVMDNPPRKPKERIINREMVLNIILVGSFMAIGTLWLFNGGLTNGDFVRAQTLAFVTIALFQVFNALNCRSRRLSFFKLGPLTNKYLTLGITASVTLEILVTELPFFQLAFGTTSLSVLDWVLVVLVSSSVFIAEEIRKLARLLFLKRKQNKQTHRQ
jgi:Ca2+-transporting ATPase